MPIKLARKGNILLITSPPGKSLTYILVFNSFSLTNFLVLNFYNKLLFSVRHLSFLKVFSTAYLSYCTFQLLQPRGGRRTIISDLLAWSKWKKRFCGSFDVVLSKIYGKFERSCYCLSRLLLDDVIRALCNHFYDFFFVFKILTLKSNESEGNYINFKKH